MTTRARQNVTPYVDAQMCAIRRTAAGSHGFTIGELVSDGASGHPSQRWTVTRQTADCDLHGFYLNTDDTARYLVVRFSVTSFGLWDGLANVAVDLSVRDGTNTVLSSDAEIPRGLKGETHSPNSILRGRYVDAAQVTCYLDIASLRAVLTAADTWRFTLALNFTGTTCALDCFQIEEVQRFSVDTSEAQGVDPANFYPRGVIEDGTGAGLQRLISTARYGYFQNRRTYVSISTPEAAPWTTTSTPGPAAAITGLIESAGVPIKHRVRPRAMRGAAANGAKVFFGCRYKTSGAGNANLTMYSGGASSPYALTLPGTSGAWADIFTGTGYLATNGTDGIDTVYFAGYLDAAGTLSIDHIWVVDDPA